MAGEKVLRSLKGLLSRFSWREMLVFSCFVMFAALLWYAHAMGSVRTAVVPVSVTYSGVPEDVLLSDSLPATIHLELRDAGRRLKMYRTNPLSYSFNLNDQIKGESGVFTLSSDMVHRAVNSLLQGTTKLQSISPEQISGSYTRQHSKLVPVRLVADITPAAQYQLVGEPVVLTETVTILGSAEQLRKVDTVATEVLVLRDVKDSVTTRVRLESVSGIRLAQDEVNVRIITEQFTEKVLTKSIVAKNVPENAHLRLFPAEVNVMLRVGVTHFNDIDEKDVEVSCVFPQTDIDKLPLQVSCHNPYVTFMRCTPAAVEFLIEKNAQTLKK